jgi:hypothetical protein
MRWVVLALLVLAILGWILLGISQDFDAGSEPLQGYLMFNAASGLPCVVVFFVLAVGVGLFLARK